MGQKQSKDRLMYQYVVNGDVEGIQFLSKQGASLEWKDREGKTPLIVAAKDPRLYGVAQTLIELGGNVNAFCKGQNGGTPLHYAAKEGLDRTVALLLSNGANAFVKNRDNQTPLDVARKNGRHLVVREIEGRMCYFSGYIREAYGPGLSDTSATQISSRVIWVVVVPRSLHRPPKRPKLELVIYSTPQDSEPRKIICLRRSKIKEPRFDQPSPALIIFDKRTKTRYKFSPVAYNEKQQLRRLYNACKGISQVKPVTSLMSTPIDSPLHPTAQPMTSRIGWDQTIRSSTPTTWSSPMAHRLSPPMTPNNDVWIHESPRQHNYIGQGVTGPWSHAPNQSPLPQKNSHTNTSSVMLQTPDRYPDTVSETVPSAPPVINETTSQDNSLCVICWEAPVEAACVPCGHASCMSCLKEIKDKNGVCPVCRAQINEVVKLYGI